MDKTSPNSGESLACRYAGTLELIREQTERYNRPDGSVRLIAVSKQHSAEAVAAVARLGQADFAENYVREGLAKTRTVAAMLESESNLLPLAWHFIGHIQSRKCRDIAETFDWVHTIDSEKVARRLDTYRADRAPLQSLIQVNLQDEPGKSGISADRIDGLAALVDSLPNLELRGLMIIPRPQTEFSRQRNVFRRMRELLEHHRCRHGKMDQLSMGMSDDMEAAISEGATLVRVGTAIFGPRTTHH